jgi:methyl-accepting chemotaxis protein
MNFGSVSIRTRILMTMLVLATALLVVGGTGLHGMQGVVDDLEDMYQRRVLVAIALGELKAKELDRQALLSLSVLTDSSESAAKFQAARKQTSAEAAELLEQYGKVQRSEEGKAIYADIDRAHDALEVAIDEVDAAVAANDDATAAKLIVTKVDPAFDVLNDALEVATEFQSKRAEEGLENARSEFSLSRTISIAAIVIALVLAGMFAMMLMRAILSGLSDALNVAEKIAGGQLGHDIDGNRRDEFGTLLSALKRMDEKLHEIVGGVRGASDAVGGAAAQLSRGNDDLSQRTQEQASALEETASRKQRRAWKR